jgi:RNA polymerase sigma-70 factor (ECF subfamily)
MMLGLRTDILCNPDEKIVSIRQMDGQRNLFWKLTEPEHLRARAYCRKLMGNREDGDDLYQDVLVTALTRFGSLRDHSAFRAWLYRIVVNTFKNRLRQPWYRRLLPLTTEIEDRAGGDDPAEEHAARRTLRRAFRALTPAERALVTLFELEGWSIAELAKLYGASEGTIKVRLSRARRRMRAALIKHASFSADQMKSKTKMCEDEICVATKPGAE